MTDSWRDREKGEGDVRVAVVLPLAILDGIWPTGVSLLSRRQHPTAHWIDVLEREVDRGLLRRVGNGTEASPYRWEERCQDAFTLAPVEVGLDHFTTRRLLARLGLSDAR